MIIREIDNPGQGNCAFYAFAIGFIDIVKHEIAKKGVSATFQKLQNLSIQALGLTADSFPIKLNEINAFDFSNQSISVLNKIQYCFRHIIYTHRKAELFDKPLNSPDEFPPTAFIDFTEMVHCFAKNDSTDNHYNGLINSSAAREYAIEVANKIKTLRQRMERLSRWYPENVQDKRYNDVRRRYMFNNFDEPINRLILEAFKADVYLKTESAIQLKSDSRIVDAMQDITVNYRWGTHRDLDDLANIFEINLNTMNYGDNNYLYGSANIANRPSITLNNRNNGHWTTNLTFLGHFKGQQYDVFTKNSILTKDEIKNILLTYTSGWKSLITPRHHLQKAKELIKACNSGEQTILDIIRTLNEYRHDTEFASNSSFKKRLDYILARANYSFSLGEQAMNDFADNITAQI
ncbi:Dot/Icm T4SS effector [Legionella busanensis]|uniref:Dot/Icm T4SS effector n=1 Tax=Legionella busanensis TaxID=190655 RepID=A0A378JK06_9GAMM|nr:hypothetical protein [Legionella busanensis]STX51071.1 Dot/Icm T4SS effector [Legionella busanensis]